MEEAVRTNSPTTYAETLEQQIRPEEISAALRKGGRNKSPGSDGIGKEFYTTNWEIIKEDIGQILNQVFCRCL
jgi:hypothetical protein